MPGSTSDKKRSPGRDGKRDNEVDNDKSVKMEKQRENKLHSLFNVNFYKPLSDERDGTTVRLYGGDRKHRENKLNSLSNVNFSKPPSDEGGGKNL